jgi:hypothetical protein
MPRSKRNRDSKPKGRPGLIVRKTRSGRLAKSKPWYDESTSEEETSTSSPTPKRSSTATATGDCVVIDVSSGGTKNDEEELDTPRKLPPTPPKTDDVNNTANNDYDYYFGDTPVGDPDDESEDENHETSALAIDLLKSARRPYKKDAKLSAFAGALKIKKSSLLGDNPPAAIGSIYNIWSPDAKISKEWKSWNINTVAKPMYDLGQYLSALKEAENLPTKSTAAETLIVLSDHFRRKASQQIVEEKAKNEKVKARALGGAKKKKTGKTIPKDINPITATRSLDFPSCPGCKCKGSVVNLFSEERLSEMTADFNRKHQERLETNPKARRTGAPQMEVACMCSRSKTMRGDWKNSSCIKCRKRGRLGSHMILIARCVNAITRMRCSLSRLHRQRVFGPPKKGMQ